MRDQGLFSALNAAFSAKGAGADAAVLAGAAAAFADTGAVTTPSATLGGGCWASAHINRTQQYSEAGSSRATVYIGSSKSQPPPPSPPTAYKCRQQRWRNNLQRHFPEATEMTLQRTVDSGASSGHGTPRA